MMMSKMLVVALVVVTISQVAAIRNGNVIERKWTGSKTCSGSFTYSQLSAGADTCKLYSDVGSNSYTTDTATYVTSNIAQSIGFQCAADAQIGKQPGELALYSDAACATDTARYGNLTSDGCLTGASNADSYKYLCGKCGLLASTYYTGYTGTQTLKMRFFSDSSCKVRNTAIADNLNATRQCQVDPSGTGSFNFACGADGTCVLIAFDDTPDCCWTPILVDASKQDYGNYFNDGACVKRGSNYIRITSGNLSAAHSTSTLSFATLAAAAIALFVAKQL